MNERERCIAEKTWQAIYSHIKLRCLLKMDLQQIYYLPKNYIKTISVCDLEDGWYLLPDYIQSDPVIQKYKSCKKHYLSNTHNDFIDGPPKRIINCEYCIQEERIN